MAVDAVTPTTGVTGENHDTSTANDESATVEVVDAERHDSDPDGGVDPNGAVRAHSDDDGPPPSDKPDADSKSRGPTSPLRLAAVVGLVSVVAMGAIAGWFGFHAYQAQQSKAERNVFLDVAKQGALNLTTIGHDDAEADVQRILDSATGEFLNEFGQNAKPFVDVVKKTESSSQGTVSEAGLESITGDEAQAIVVVSVKTTTLAAPEQPLRSWRMRLSVQRSGDDFKISKVGFV